MMMNSIHSLRSQIISPSSQHETSTSPTHIFRRGTISIQKAKRSSRMKSKWMMSSQRLLRRVVSVRRCLHQGRSHSTVTRVNAWTEWGNLRDVRIFQNIHTDSNLPYSRHSTYIYSISLSPVTHILIHTLIQIITHTYVNARTTERKKR